MMHKILHEDEKSFHVQHPDGSTFKVAKRKLDEATISKIRAYAKGGEVKSNEVKPDPNPISQSFTGATGSAGISQALSNLSKYADGGLVDPTLAYQDPNAVDARTGLPITAQNIPISAPLEAPVPEEPVSDRVINPEGVKTLMKTAGAFLDPAGYVGNQVADGLIGGVSKIPGAIKDMVTMPNPAKVASTDSLTAGDGNESYAGKPQISAPTAPQGTPGNPALTEMQKAQAQEQQGVSNLAKAQTELGTAQAKTYDDEANQLKQLQDRFELHRKDLDDRTESLFNSALKEKIDPNHYWNNLGTGNRILANISIALGGLAGGLSGKGGNMALDQINKEIDRDIDSQKANLNQKNNLLSKNLEITKNLDEATLLTRSQLTAITGAMVAKNAAMATGPEAQANAQMLLGKLKQQAQQANASLAMIQAKGSLGNGGGQTINPEALPKEDRERLVVLPNGQQRLAYSSEAAKDTREKLATAVPILNSLDQLDKLGASALVPGSKEANRAEALRSQLIPQINEFSKINRLTPEDEKLMGAAIFDPTSFRQIAGGRERSQVLRDVITDRLQNHLASNLEGGYKPAARLKTLKPYAQR